MVFGEWWDWKCGTLILDGWEDWRVFNVLKGCVTCVYDGDCQLGTLILFVDTLICRKNKHSCSKG